MLNPSFLALYCDFYHEKIIIEYMKS